MLKLALKCWIALPTFYSKWMLTGHLEHRICKDVRMLHTEKLLRRQNNSRARKTSSAWNKTNWNVQGEGFRLQVFPAKSVCIGSGVSTALSNVLVKISWLHVKGITMFSIRHYLLSFFKVTEKNGWFPLTEMKTKGFYAYSFKLA